MRKSKKIILAAFILLITSIGRVNAAVLDSQVLADKIKKDVVKQINEIVPGKISVEVRGIPFKSIQIPDGKVTIEASTNLRLFSSLTVAKVDILVNGEEVKTFGVPLKITIYDEVWVVKDNINKGESLNESNISLERKDISLIANNAARQTFVPYGTLTRKSFRTGEILDTRYVENAPTVIKNSLVSVIFQTDNLSITVPCEALDNGKIGDFIKVRNKQYRKDYTGKVISSNTVLVNL